MVITVTTSLSDVLCPRLKKHSMQLLLRKVGLTELQYFMVCWISYLKVQLAKDNFHLYKMNITLTKII